MLQRLRVSLTDWLYILLVTFRVEPDIQLRRLTGIAGLIALTSVAWSRAAYAQTFAEPAAIERSIPTDLKQQASAPTILPSAPEPRPDDHHKGRFTLGAVNIDGATVFSEEQLSRYFEPYLATEVDQPKLSQLARAITSQYRKSGYVLSYATVPSQDVQAGMVRLAVVEGRIGQVSIRGAGSAQRAIEATADSLVHTGPVRQSQLERTIGLIRDFPGLSVTDIGIERSNAEPGLYTLNVKVVHDRRRALSYFDNRGTGNLGHSRFYNSLSWSSVAIAGDEFRIDLFAMPGSRSHYLYGQVLGALPLGRSGLRMSISASRGGEYLRADQDFRGRTDNVSAQLTYPFMRSRDLTIIGKTSITDWRTDGTIAHARLLRDRLRVLRAGLNFSNEGRTRFEGEVMLSQGVGFAGMTRAGDPLASRINASGRFTKATFMMLVGKPLGDLLMLRATAAGQYSDRPLLSAEQFSLGGSKVGRAFKFNEVTGDRGVGAGIELSYRLGSPPKNRRGLELFGFLDGGLAADVKSQTSPARTRSLASTGVGTRFNLAGASFSIEAALPLSRSSRHSPRLFVSALRSF